VCGPRRSLSSQKIIMKHGRVARWLPVLGLSQYRIWTKPMAEYGFSCLCLCLRCDRIDRLELNRIWPNLSGYLANWLAGLARQLQNAESSGVGCVAWTWKLVESCRLSGVCLDRLSAGCLLAACLPSCTEKNRTKSRSIWSDSHGKRMLFKGFW